MKKSINILIIIFLFLFQIAYALENIYPNILGYEITDKSEFVDYVSYFFAFATSIGSVILIGVIIMAGINFILAGGDPSKVSQAKNRVKDGFIGLVILFFIYLILKTINPGIIAIENPDLEKCVGGGIVVTVEKPGFNPKKMCIWGTQSKLEIDGTITSTEIKFEPGQLREVWAYKEYDFKGTPTMLYQDLLYLTDGPMPSFNITSDMKSIFILEKNKGLYLYDEKNYTVKKYPPFFVGLKSFADLNNVPIDNNYMVNYDNITTSFSFIWDKSNPNIKYRAVLFEDTNYSGKCYLDTGGDPIPGEENLEIPKILFDPRDIGDNTLSSLITYKSMPDVYGKVTLYNKTNCMLDDEVEDKCELEIKKFEGYNVRTGGDQPFYSRIKTCPDFKGDIKSVTIEGKAGFVIRATDGYCMYFDVNRNNGNNCINLENTRVFYESGCGLYDPTTAECMRPLLTRPYEIIVFPLSE